MARVAEQGDFRPMGGSPEAMDDLRGILAGRASLYAKADTVVETAGKSVDGSFDDLLNAVVSTPK
jgi:XRE family aerobic/anaerobic benzoate catabolism transcriptional regulator